VLEEEHSYFVVGAEHIYSRFTEYGCYGAPIRNRRNGRIEGVLTLLCRASDSNPLMLGFTEQAAAAIEEQMLARATAGHRRLMETFLSANRRHNQPVAAINEETLLWSAAASRLFDKADQSVAREIAMRAYRDEQLLIEPLVLGPDRIVVVRATPVYDGRKAVGALLDFEAPAPARSTATRSPAISSKVRPQLADRILTALGGSSAPWVAAVERGAAAIARGDPVLLSGEPGVGKRKLGRALLGVADVRVLDAALLLPAAVSAWLGQLDAAVAASQSILLTHIEALDQPVASAVAARLAAQLDAADRMSPFVATCTLPAGALPPTGTILDGIAPCRVTVPPLRERGTDIPDLVARLAQPKVVSPSALQKLASATWPGSVSELRRVLSRAAIRAAGPRIEASDLPPELGPASVRPHGMIEQAERHAIEAALIATGGDKREAARRLGISLATLYRRIKTMRIAV